MREKYGSFLQAWLHHFDRDQNRRITRDEFHAGMKALGYPGNIYGLWEEICQDLESDNDLTFELTFEEIDQVEATIWSSFRRWCGSQFSSAKDMIRQCKQAVRRNGNIPVEDELLYEDEFIQGLVSLGWDVVDVSHGFTEMYETIIFFSMDPEGEGCLSASHQLKWVDNEVRRHRQKEAAKRRAQRLAEHKAAGTQAMKVALQDFKETLRRNAGSLFKGWRRLLDPDGSMTVQRADLFKVCQKLNWKGDVRSLWKALDHDNSQITTLEEFDPPGAQILAQFKTWAQENFGQKPAAAMFHTFDKQNLRRLRYAQFVHEVQSRGFHRKAKSLLLWLDWQDKKCLHEEDFSFLDHWRPPAWLVAQPSPKAAEEFKRHLLHKYGHFLKAWRGCLDKDSSNNCNWHEFQEAARLVKFTGDVAGAWLCFDEDLSGSISLKEIDPVAHVALVDFKIWADDEFGGVRSAFKVLDTDGSNELTYREFRGACRNFGYQGDLKTLFEALDQHGEQQLQYKEVVFLDDWETNVLVSTEGADTQQEPQKEAEQAPISAAIEYFVPSPGPGAYEVFSGFAATPLMPTARHAGAHSFTRRRAGCGPWPKFPKSVGPARYEPSLKPIIDRKPAWSFGGSARMGQATPRISPRSQIGNAREQSMPSPGPGSYDLRPTFSAPRYSMRPRRMLRLHPSERAHSECRAISR
jgi:Ca2+-binding EF-hand superfamily protein